MLNGFKNFSFIEAIAVVLIAVFASSIPSLGEDWNNYTASYSIGTGEQDWWTEYPDQHVSAGSKVDHPSWVKNALKDKPLLISVHSSNCVPCLTQVPRIQAVVQDFGRELKFYDVLAEGDGYEKALAILDVYNPSGAAQYVPTTIFITLTEGPDGDVGVAWHARVDVMSQEEIESYVKDSIYYHNQNIDDWS